jgi:aspartate/methionine/tyrosine aminotransferase
MSPTTQLSQVALPLLDAAPLAARAGHIPGEGAIETLARALELESRGVNIIHLEIGEPEYATPEHIVEAGINAMRAGRLRYGPAPGSPGLRAAIAEHIAATRKIEINPANVLIMPGAKPVIFFTILALVESGDEVILPDPGFPAYAATVKFAGGVPVSLPLRSEENFGVDIERLRNLIGKRTKLLILNSPANPTGGVLSRGELEEIAQVAIENKLWVLSDEIYSQLYYGDQPPASIASVPGMPERTIVLDGFSKTYAMTGWRLGYGAFPEPLVRPVTNMIINSHTCVPLFIQDAGVAALRGAQDNVVEMRSEYHSRRDLVVQTLNAIPGLHCTTPDGAFYAFPQISGLRVANARAFTNTLLEAGVAVLPGTDFGEYGESHFRISYAAGRDKLIEGLARVRSAVEQLG